MGKRSSGFICFWIFVYQQNIWNEKYIFEWYIYIFNLLYRWENVRLDFLNFGWYIFFLVYFIEGKTVRSVVYGWLQSHIWGGSMNGIGPLRMLDRKWPEVTSPEVTWLFTLLSFLSGFINRTFSWNQFYFSYLATR